MLFPNSPNNTKDNFTATSTQHYWNQDFDTIISIAALLIGCTQVYLMMKKK